MKELGGDTIDVMRSIKRALDPHFLMNPSKIFEAVREDSPKDPMMAVPSTNLERPENLRYNGTKPAH